MTAPRVTEISARLTDVKAIQPNKPDDCADGKPRPRLTRCGCGRAPQWATRYKDSPVTDGPYFVICVCGRFARSWMRSRAYKLWNAGRRDAHLQSRSKAQLSDGLNNHRTTENKPDEL